MDIIIISKRLSLPAYFGMERYSGTEGEEMRIWYGEDLSPDGSESDNSGEICVNVDVFYSTE